MSPEERPHDAARRGRHKPGRAASPETHPGTLLGGLHLPELRTSKCPLFNPVCGVRLGRPQRAKVLTRPGPVTQHLSCPLSFLEPGVGGAFYPEPSILIAGLEEARAAMGL